MLRVSDSLILNVRWAKPVLGFGANTRKHMRAAAVGTLDVSAAYGLGKESAFKTACGKPPDCLQLLHACSLDCGR